MTTLPILHVPLDKVFIMWSSYKRRPRTGWFVSTIRFKQILNVFQLQYVVPRVLCNVLYVFGDPIKVIRERSPRKNLKTDCLIGIEISCVQYRETKAEFSTEYNRLSKIFTKLGPRATGGKLIVKGANRKWPRHEFNPFALGHLNEMLNLTKNVNNFPAIYF